MLYGVWDFDDDGWMRCTQTGAILAFERESHAERVAADEYGYREYAEAKDDGWVEVRPLELAASPAASGI